MTVSRSPKTELSSEFQTLKAELSEDLLMEVKKGWERQEEFFQSLAAATANFGKVQQMGEQIATLEVDVKYIRQDVSQLRKWVQDGNGKPSIMHRLDSVESVATSQARLLEKVEEHANSITVARMMTKTQLVVGLSGMILTVLISTVALIAQFAK